MNAWMLNAPGDIVYTEVDKPKLSFGDVLVAVKAVGVCGSDIPRIFVNGAHRMPLIPGHEFAGEVVCAPGVKSHWMGKRVGVYPLIPCMKCKQCLERRYELCRAYDYLGSRSDGAYAEYVKVPAANLIELPENVSYEAGAMLEPLSVAVHAFRRVRPVSGERVLVWGLGTIGLLLVQILLANMDADDIYVCGNKEYQKERVTGLGIPEKHYFDSAGDMSNFMAENKGANVVFECVGKKETVSGCIDALLPGGRGVLVGNPASDIALEQNTYWKLLRNQLTISGTWNSSFLREDTDDWHYAVDMMAKGTIHPEQLITHRYSLEDADRGLRVMKDKTENYIKIMIEP